MSLQAFIINNIDGDKNILPVIYGCTLDQNKDVLWEQYDSVAHGDA